MSISDKKVKPLLLAQSSLNSYSIQDLHMDFTKISVKLLNTYGDLDDLEYDEFPQEIEDEINVTQIPLKNLETVPDRLHNLSLIQQIEQINNGSYSKRCLEKVSNPFVRGKDTLEGPNRGVDRMFRTHFKKHKDGTLEMVNPDLLKKQKQVLGYLIKQLGSALIAGRSVLHISFPVYIFESKSLLERTANSFVYLPRLMEKASQTTNALEQFKYAISGYFASLAIDVSPEKPFNPILGETFQCHIGGVPFYSEQISHHPPILAFQMIGDHFKLNGTKEFVVNVNANSVKGRYYGYPEIKFNNTGNTIQAQYPVGVMGGTTIGKRTFGFTGKFYIFDIKNRLYCEIEFDPSETLFKKKKNPKDYFLGGIWKVNDKFMEKLEKEVKKHHEIELKFKEKEHAVEKLDVIEGCWLDHINIGGQIFWKYGDPWPNELQYIDNALPSDSNFRLDVMYLKAGDEQKSQEQKIVLEEKQRGERKLREQYEKKHRK